jgi:hypothetical protein
MTDAGQLEEFTKIPILNAEAVLIEATAEVAFRRQSDVVLGRKPDDAKSSDRKVGRNACCRCFQNEGGEISPAASR